MPKEVSRIVITGGPCAGKSSVMKEIFDHFTDKGYRVLTVAETATELINSNIAPWNCPSTKEFQDILMGLQLDKEKAYEHAIRAIDDEKILLILDRGAMDNKAYLNEKQFDEILSARGLSEKDLLNRYDAVFHLETSAKGNLQDYSLDTNLARKESPEEAIEVDNRTMKVWKDHPRMTIIPSEKDFEIKKRNVISAIESFLDQKDQ